MPALPEYRTRELLQKKNIPVVNGLFFPVDSVLPEELPNPPVYLKAQIPGATSRATSGLVMKADTESAVRIGLEKLLISVPGGNSDGVLVTESVEIVREYYAACMLDLGSMDRKPGGVLLWSPSGGSGVEERADSLVRIPFSLLHPPAIENILAYIKIADNPGILAEFLHGLIETFCRYKLTVLEVNPIAVLADGSLLTIDCRAEFESRAVSIKDAELFIGSTTSGKDLTPLEEAVKKINEADPSGTGFFRQNREKPSEGKLRVATNLCGGGGKMLWEMATGGRNDIYTMNESDTSGGLSAFKSYRILRVILAQEGSQALLLTGSGMAFQNQHHLAAAVWKALRESPTPLPSLLRFGGTDEDKAHELIRRVESTLSVKVKTYRAEIFPNAMIDDLPGIVTKNRGIVELENEPDGKPLFSVDTPPGDFYFYPEKHQGKEAPEFVKVCPTGFLEWNPEKRTIEKVEGSRCTGCLLCETVSLLEGNGELRIHLDLPWEVTR